MMWSFPLGADPSPKAVQAVPASLESLTRTQRATAIGRDLRLRIWCSVSGRSIRLARDLRAISQSSGCTSSRSRPRVAIRLCRRIASRSQEIESLRECSSDEWIPLCKHLSDLRVRICEHIDTNSDTSRSVPDEPFRKRQVCAADHHQQVRVASGSGIAPR